ncbi:MAG TPA: FHA domain-containing protein [Planctomycetaceae bacterium]|nr:FHA domain-containing protein [Planctomycetaceae bacterium]
MSSVSRTSSKSHASGSRTLRTERRFSLEVLQGKTNHRLRPLPLGRLCVGRGEKCWLRLGGHDMPEIHSWLDVGLREIAVYVFEEVPPVQVNGKRVRFALLHGGESLRIGTFEFVIHCQEVEPTARALNGPHFDLSQMSDVSDHLERPLEELSAEELIGLLDDELRQITRYESRERAGMQQLLSAVREMQEELAAEQEPPTIPFPAPQPQADAPEFASILKQLELLTQSLETERVQAASRGSKVPSLSESLLLSQREIAGDLDRLMGSLGTDSEEDERGERKAIA